MQMAIDAASFTPAEADELRQAMGSKRSSKRMARLRERLYDGMAGNGITGEVADEIAEKLEAFAHFGFPESHSISFAYLVYASSWLKHYYPAAFCAALLNAQPMGFYSPQTLVADARRHGVEIRSPDVNASAAVATLEGERDHPVVRLGLSSVRTIGTELAEKIAAGRPYASMEDLAYRVGRHRTAGRGAGHGRCLRLLRARPSGGAVGGRCGRPGPARRAGRDDAGHQLADAAGHDRRRADDRRPLGDRDHHRRLPDPPRPGAARRARRDRRGPTPPDRARHQGAGRRRRHALAAAGNRRRHHVPQPRGRDRDDQRDLLARACGCATAGWPGRRRR